MTQKQKTTFIYAAPVVLLCIPLIGNFTSKEFDWSVGDFGIAAVLLFGTAFLIDLILRIIKNRTYKILVTSIAIVVSAYCLLGQNWQLVYSELLSPEINFYTSKKDDQKTFSQKAFPAIGDWFFPVVLFVADRGRFG